MALLAFMMNKGVTQPVYFYSIPNLWAITLTVPVLTWILFRWSKWTRLLGLSIVALSLAYVINNLKCAFADRDVYAHPESDYRFLLLSFAAGMLPIVAATAAFVSSRRKPKPPATSDISAD